jgi:hypothetical protein
MGQVELGSVLVAKYLQNQLAVVVEAVSAVVVVAVVQVEVDEVV